MEKKLTFARTLAAVFGAALVIALIVIWNNHTTIKELQDPNRNNITVQRDLIREACSGNSPADVERCADQLQRLSELLTEFSKGLPVNTLNQASGGTFNVGQ